MEPIFLKLFRRKYTETYTSGKMYINNRFFGFTLENPVRPPHIKIKGITAIDPGDYELIISRNSRGLEKVYICDVPLFTGIQCHGGNTVDDTDGCPLVAEHKVAPDTIQGSLEAELIKKIKGAEAAYITIINLNQLQR